MDIEIYGFSQQSCPDCGSPNDGTVRRVIDPRLKPGHLEYGDERYVYLERSCTGCGRSWMTFKVGR